MSKGARAAIAITILLGGVGFWMWSDGGSPEERRIRGRLHDLAAEFNAGTTDGIGTVVRAARIGEFFTADVIVELGHGSPPISGRETLMGMAARLQPRTAAFIVELKDVNIEVLDSARAEVTLTLVIRRRVASGEESLDAREFSVELSHGDDGLWRLSRVVAIDTLR